MLFLYWPQQLLEFASESLYEVKYSGAVNFKVLKTLNCVSVSSVEQVHTWDKFACVVSVFQPYCTDCAWLNTGNYKIIAAKASHQPRLWLFQSGAV